MLLALALASHLSLGNTDSPHAGWLTNAGVSRSAQLVRAELFAARAELSRTEPLPALAVLGGTFLGGLLLGVTGVAVAASAPPCGTWCISNETAAGVVLLLAGGGAIAVGLVVALVMAIVNAVRSPARAVLTEKERALTVDLQHADVRDAGPRPAPPPLPGALVVPLTVPL